VTYENGREKKALVPQERGTSKQQSIEVIHTYLQKGQGLTRSIWVKVSPKNLALRLIIIPPLVLIGSLIFLLLLLALGFTLMALSLYLSLSRQKQEKSA
jgi:hypothetical protein